MAVEYHDYAPATTSQPAIDGRPYGPGPRVPMWVVSPWSRGGWVNSQVCDHTSTLLFLEKCFGVVEPQISAYRRAVCGDLTSAFNFERPNNEPLPTLAGPHDQGRRRRADRRAAGAAEDRVRAADPALPVQADRRAPLAALPYELHTSARTDALNGRVQLLFANSGRAAAVFHVYDKLHLSDRLPRRYVVEPGKQLAGDWASMTDDAGLYDLWVLGPNGFHRHFKGDLNRLRAGGVALPEIRVGYERRQGDLYLQLRNDGRRDCRFTVQSNKPYARPEACEGGGKDRHDDHGHGNDDRDAARPRQRQQRRLVERPGQGRRRHQHALEPGRQRPVVRLRRDLRCRPRLLPPPGRPGWRPAGIRSAIRRWGWRTASERARAGEGLAPSPAAIKAPDVCSRLVSL